MTYIHSGNVLLIIGIQADYGKQRTQIEHANSHVQLNFFHVHIVAVHFFQFLVFVQSLFVISQMKIAKSDPLHGQSFLFRSIAVELSVERGKNECNGGMLISREEENLE